MFYCQNLKKIIYKHFIIDILLQLRGATKNNLEDLTLCVKLGEGRGQQNWVCKPQKKCEVFMFFGGSPVFDTKYESVEYFYFIFQGNCLMTIL